jgi:serine/threonine protein kinase
LNRCAKVREYYVSAPDGDGKTHAVPIELRHPIKHARKPLTRDTVFGPPDFMDLVSKMLCYDPYDRITPEEAFAHPFFRPR